MATCLLRFLWVEMKSIYQKGDIFSFWNALSNFKLHFATTRSFTFSGFNLAPLGVTTLPATEKTRCSDLDEAAGTGKTTLTSLATRPRGDWDSWCFHHYRDDLRASSLVGLYLHRRHFAIAPSILSPKYLLTLDACFSEQHCSFGWEAWLSVEEMNM